MLTSRLMLALTLSAGLLAVPAELRAELSFRGIPAAHDVASARELLPARIARVVDYWSRQRGRAFPRQVGSRAFAQIAAAKLYAQREVATVNRALLDRRARPYAAYGTRVTIIPGLCAREGDYDFMAEELVRLAYTQLSQPLTLWPETAKKIAWQLLPEAGVRHHRRFRLGLCGRHRDSENHILMTESSRYLTNQLRRTLGDRSAAHDNAKNGFDPWLLRHLAHFLRGHFEEYNSRPYQGYTVQALENLHSFADDARVASSAQIVLDYLSAVFAVQSNGLRRDPPFRRQARYADTPLSYDHDAETPRFALLAGNHQYLERFRGRVPYGSHFMLSAALGRYRVPDAILDLIVRKDHGAYYQRLHHDGVEIYASSPSFLLSAGGVFVRHFQFGSAEQHGWARATSVIPTRDLGTDSRDWLRIRGSDAPATRNNTCVAPNFACGLNLEIPASIPAACRERHGAFLFLDLTEPRCPLDLGFYVAARVAACDDPRCRGRADNVGLFELREASEDGFAHFRQQVLRRNRRTQLHARGLSTHVTADGRRIAFEPLAEGQLWPIVSVDGRPQLRAFERWPLAEGDLIHANGDGLVTVDNPFRGERLVLDVRDPLRPVRSIEVLPALDPGGAKVAQQDRAP